MEFAVSSLDKDGSFVPEDEAKEHKWYGSGFLNHDRPISTEDDFREFKMAKSSCGGDGQQMLSFYSPNSRATVTRPYPQHIPSRKTTGVNGASTHGVMPAAKALFTPSQWMELEHQALIYKYMTANVPVPSSLLIPIRKALEFAGFSAFPGLKPRTLGWGAFQLGLSSDDPEPGRCRRTDGKKWRCAKDAVPDQKYCERHMNRGRHRSRKPVEGLTGRSAAAITTNSSKITAKSSASPASMVPAGCVSGSAVRPHHQFNNSKLDTPNSNRNLPQQDNAYGGSSSISEFGLICSDSLLNTHTLVSCGRNPASDNLNHEENKSQHSFRQFMDDWPRNQSVPSGISPWQETAAEQDRTQLSISIASPSRMEFPAMGLGINTMHNEQNQRHANWIPISWEPSLGGPLGEALHAANNCTVEFTNAKALNLIEGWDSSPRSATSPTAVLHKGATGSLSNSSAGSSPRAGISSSRTLHSFCNGVIIPGEMNPPLPAL